MLFEKGSEGKGLWVKGFVSEHDFNKSKGIRVILSYLKLCFTKTSFHKTLLIVYFKSLTILLFRKMKETNY